MFFWNKINAQKVISITGSIIAVILSSYVFYYVWENGTQKVNAGNWDAPFGIVFVADTLAVTLVLLTALSGLAVSIFSAGSVIKDRLRFGYFPIFHLRFSTFTSSIRIWGTIIWLLFVFGTNTFGLLVMEFWQL